MRSDRRSSLWPVESLLGRSNDVFQAWGGGSGRVRDGASTEDSEGTAS